jgi:hypothetical protein
MRWVLKQIYEACPESKDTKVLNMYNVFNLYPTNAPNPFKSSSYERTNSPAI